MRAQVALVLTPQKIYNYDLDTDNANAHVPVAIKHWRGPVFVADAHDALRTCGTRRTRARL